MYPFSKYCCYGAFLLNIQTCIFAYNFDVDNLIIYENPAEVSMNSRASYAGFSVLLKNSENAGSSIFIGVPRANSSAYHGSKEPGTVFKCGIMNSCKEFVVGGVGTKKPGDNCWLGSSMSISNGSKSNMMVCGPRCLDKDDYEYQSSAYPMEGLCYKADPESYGSGSAIRLPKISYKRVTNYGLIASLGFSIHANSRDPDKFIIGAPGVERAQGEVFQYTVDSNGNGYGNDFVSLGTDSKSFQFWSNSGYAVTSGYYFDSSGGLLYGTGIPRAANLRGRVVIFKNIGHPYVMTVDNASFDGNQVGEYFGSALASCDVDGNGRDELLVGAPQWTKHVDEGRIYVFRTNSNNKFEIWQTFEGQILYGRFGSAITCLGDIDRDGYADVAVGAPYAGNGMVYIFNGGKSGLRKSQQISAPLNTKGFGISMSAFDIDENGFPDLAVGAYLSGHVILYRSKSAVTMTVTLTSLSKSRSLNQTARFFDVKFCSSYSGNHAPRSLDVTSKLTVDEIYQRAVVNFQGRSQQTHEYNHTIFSSSQSACETFSIKLKDKIADFLNPISLSVSQNLRAVGQATGAVLVKNEEITGEDHFCVNCPVINPFNPMAESHLIIPFEVKCGSDAVCDANLQINMTTNLKNPGYYVIDSVPYITLTIDVRNTGEAAYLTKVVVRIPITVRIRLIPITCTSLETESGITVTCDIANPLNSDTTKSVRMDLDMSQVTSDIKEIVFEASANTQSRNAAKDGVTRHRIECEVETDIGITGKAEMDQYSFIVKGDVDESPNIFFQHNYLIQNYEVTQIKEALLSISFPTHFMQDSGEIEVAKLNQTTGYLDGQEFTCTGADTLLNRSQALSYDATTMNRWLTNGKSEILDKKFTIIENRVYAASPSNRTLNINCTNPSVKCTTINCKLDVFKNKQSTAKLVLLFDLQLSNVTDKLIQDKDIIFFVSNASVKINIPSIESLSGNNVPDLIMIGTVFIETYAESQVPIWAIALSIFIGLLLLVLIIVGCFKFGFFNRTKKLELQALLKQKVDVTSQTNRPTSQRFEISDSPSRAELKSDDPMADPIPDNRLEPSDPWLGGYPPDDPPYPPEG
ncbi:integrin alpha-PS3-like isoform X2 [Athalia rosae]|uniref:integrin alpha-PS3-like isoform X2 n=1 Tax=Athalia rosae TaxID=37344 RepID=UPI0020336EB6|nr:integrin alpha-PS3-like isoform X2 [Athalia rosae]